MVEAYGQFYTILCKWNIDSVNGLELFGNGLHNGRKIIADFWTFLSSELYQRWIHFISAGRYNA